jgi:hypothetical protein
MDTDGKTAAAAATEETFTHTELLLEQEKIKLEHERILLEHERLDIARERLGADASGRTAIKLSTVVLLSIICTLIGGILGALSASTQLYHYNTARMQNMVQTLRTTVPDAVAVVTNEIAASENELPGWLKAMKPKGAYSGVSLVVIQ